MFDFTINRQSLTPEKPEKRGSRLLRRFAFWLLTALLLSSPLRAQDAGSNAGMLWKDAQNKFNSGNYAGASDVLNTIIKTYPVSADAQAVAGIKEAPPNRQWLEPVYFMRAAASFNAKDWTKAIAGFSEYRQLFTHSARMTQTTSLMAQAYLLADKPDFAIPYFQALLADPDYHAKTVMLLVEAYKRAKKDPQAISLLEKERMAPNADPDFLEKVNMRLSHFLLDAKNEDRAMTLLQQMDANIAYVQEIPDFNAVASRLGDMYLAEHKTDQALDCYRRVRDNDEIIVLQKKQIERLQQKRVANMARIQSDPLNSSQLQLDNKDIDAQIVKDQQILTQCQTLPPVLPSLFLRIGHAYYTDGALWESAVVYRELMRRFPKSDDYEAALYGSIVIFDQLKQTDRAQGLCQAYLTQYPKGKYADSVGFIRGALAFDAQDFDQALAYFGDSLKNQPNSPRREQIELILGDIKLRQQKFDDAIAAYQAYRKDFPNGIMVEQAEYRSALALLFGGKGDEAAAAINAYIQHYPKGDYVADGEYRLAVIKFGYKQYDAVLADCAVWQQKHGSAGPLAEVLSLMGDTYASQDKNDEAVAAYVKSYKAAQTTEVLNYSIMAAAKILQKQAKWTDIANMFQEFVKIIPIIPPSSRHSSGLAAPTSSSARKRRGKQFLATTAKKYLNDPSREAVDQIITQLAQLFAKKHLPVPIPAATPPATPAATGSTTATASTPPVAPPPVAPPAEPPVDTSDPAKDLADILTTPDLASQPTAKARIVYAQSELARIQRKPDVEQQLLLQIAKDFKPDDLSPILLGQVGDCLVQSGQSDQAIPFYNHLMDEYDQSPVVDYAYNGLGRIAFDEKDYTKASAYYGKALDKGLAVSKLKEITLGEAQSLLALKRFEDARPLFEQVAGTRAWRGPATALSVYSLGEIQMDQGKFAEANAYYQRVFVAYQKYPDIQAKAYLRSGEAFEKLGKLPEAINTYSEMLKNPNLATFPEIPDAKQRLQQLVQK